MGGKQAWRPQSQKTINTGTFRAFKEAQSGQTNSHFRSGFTTSCGRWEWGGARVGSNWSTGKFYQDQDRQQRVKAWNGSSNMSGLE